MYESMYKEENNNISYIKKQSKKCIETPRTRTGTPDSMCNDH